MSLRELGIRDAGSYERGVRHHVRDRTADAQGGRRRSRDRDRRPSRGTNEPSPARRIGHQSSLRSLLSTSDIDSTEMRAEILRQIMEEGILDGIDLDHIDISQEDELSERIAEAYRQRHGQSSRDGNPQADTSALAHSSESRPDRERQQRRPSRSPNPAQTQQNSHPPVSRPHLLEVRPTGQGHRRRTSSETRRHTSPSPSAGRRGSSESHRQAARSATDLSNGSDASATRRTRPRGLSTSGRRTTDPENLRPRRESQDRVAQPPRSPRSRPRDNPSTGRPVLANPSNNISQQHVVAVPSTSNPRTAQAGFTEPSQSSPEVATSYPEPSIPCDRCGKRNIEYDLHWNCSKCQAGSYNLCLPCYRLGRGCLHWFGFGYKAMEQYRIQEPLTGYPLNHSPPHILQGRRYLRPPVENIRPASANAGPRSTSNPSEHLQSGPFCSKCSQYTPQHYWRCDYCNSGEWGFCNSCVNQGKCCTHSLLPLTHTAEKGTHDRSQMTPPQTSPRNMMSSTMTDPLYGEHYRITEISTKCAVCTYPIPPSSTRFHCPQCNEGDYDLDATCYHKMVYHEKINPEDGPMGWRRCPSGHRMIIVGFEDSSLGQRRIVVADLVGGHGLKQYADQNGRLEWKWQEGQQKQVKTVDTPSTTAAPPTSENAARTGTPPLLKKYPPSGGVGKHVQALWSWWPQDGADDELAFPKGAEIREVDDINGDWFWGVYCGRKGVFPSNYGRVVGVVDVSL